MESIFKVSSMFETKSEGRLVINEPGCANIGIPTKNSSLKVGMIYNLFLNCFNQCRIDELDFSTFDSTSWEIDSLLLTKQKELIFTKEEIEKNKTLELDSIGRLIRISNELIILFISKNNTFFNHETIYEITNNEVTGISIVEKGKTTIFQRNNTLPISTLLLSLSNKFIFTDREYYSLKAVGKVS